MGVYCSERYLDNALEYIEDVLDYWKTKEQKRKGNYGRTQDYEQEEYERRKSCLEYQVAE